ncbi:MAG: DUF4410 domain-containing protein [Bryobacteraceae bacterium]
MKFVSIVYSIILCGIACAQVPGTGRVQIKPIQSYSGASPLAKPTAIVVYNFAATPEEVELNHAVLNRVRMHMSGAQDDEKAQLSRKIVDEFSDSLIKDLQKTGRPISRGIPGELPADHTLAVQGDFLLIDEGNRARRMAIGLGAGASKVEANVQCFIRQPAQNIVITEFRAISKSSRKPGAAETMGAGAAPEVSAAATGATELKQGAEGDTDRMAKAIAKQITKTMTAQGWIEPLK